MDWGSVPDWISSTANIGVAVAAGFAAYEGIQRLNAWHRETVGRRRIELAEEVISDFYEARDILRWVRSPFAYSHEGKERPGREKESHDVQRVRDTYHVQIERLTKRSELFARMNARKYRVIATYGPEAAAPYDKIQTVHSQIIISAQPIMWALEKSPSDWEKGMLPKWRATIWEGSDDKDEVKAEIDAAVAEVERCFRREIEQAEASRD